MKSESEQINDEEVRALIASLKRIDKMDAKYRVGKHYGQMGYDSIRTMFSPEGVIPGEMVGLR